jgi:hypothetical protein
MTESCVARLTKPKRKLPPVCYYDLARNWHKIEPHAESAGARAVLKRDFDKYLRPKGKVMEPGSYPRDYEDCNGFQFLGYRKRVAPWRRFVKFMACHWLVNFNLVVALLAVPDLPWRIVTSLEHSTVWDGAGLLFEFNHLALRVPTDESLELARKGGVVLPVGHLRRTYRPVRDDDGWV